MSTASLLPSKLDLPREAKRKTDKIARQGRRKTELINIVNISNQSQTVGIAPLGQCHARRRHHLRLLDPLSDPLLHQHLQRAEIRRHDDQRLHCCRKTLQCQCDSDSGVSTESDCSRGTWRSSCKCSREKKTPLVGGKQEFSLLTVCVYHSGLRRISSVSSGAWPVSLPQSPLRYVLFLCSAWKSKKSNIKNLLVALWIGPLIILSTTTVMLLRQ